MHKVKDLNKFCVKENSSLQSVLEKIEINGFKFVVVLNQKNRLLGIITDGDIRRAVLKKNTFNLIAKNITNKKLFYLFERELSKLSETKKLKNISQIPVVNKDKKLTALYISENDNFERVTPVIIMAGGKGVRLQPFTKLTPKPLLKIGNTTFIDLIINSFASQKYINFKIITNYKKNLVKKHFEKQNDTKNIKIFEEKNYLGTVGGLRLIKKELTNHFFLSNCDIFCNVDYDLLEKWHIDNKVDMTILAVKKSIKVPYGVINLDNRKKVKSITEKPESNFLILSGLYVLNKRVVELIPKNKAFDMDSLINSMIKKKYKIQCYPVEQGWYDFGVKDQYFKNMSDDSLISLTKRISENES